MPFLFFQCLHSVSSIPPLPSKGCWDGRPPHMMPSQLSQGRMNSSLPLPLYPKHYYSSSKSRDQTLTHELPRAKMHGSIFVSSVCLVYNRLRVMGRGSFAIFLSLDCCSKTLAVWFLPLSPSSGGSQFQDQGASNLGFW